MSAYSVESMKIDPNIGMSMAGMSGHRKSVGHESCVRGGGAERKGEGGEKKVEVSGLIRAWVDYW